MNAPRSDDALATRDEFLGVVSHDLRNMLNGMIGFAALIEKGVSRGKVDTGGYVRPVVSVQE